MNILHNTLRVWAMNREFRAVIAELNAYTDRQLDDLGIRRADIPRVAYEEAERRIATPAAQRRPSGDREVAAPGALPLPAGSR
jgi:uncharacterized protein YjiS (DUF1127 family)